jgi:Tol biopolymer transport system component
VVLLELSGAAQSRQTHNISQDWFCFPTGPGEPKPLLDGSIHYQAAAWFPDGKRVAFIGNEQGHGSQLYVQEEDVGGAK